MTEQQTRHLSKSDLTLHIITKPLRQAMIDHAINEDTVMTQLADILTKASSRDQDKIRIAEIFVKLLGIVETVNINVNEIDAALESLEMKQKKRNKITQTAERPNTETK